MGLMLVTMTAAVGAVVDDALGVTAVGTLVGASCGSFLASFFAFLRGD